MQGKNSVLEVSFALWISEDVSVLGIYFKFFQVQTISLHAAFTFDASAWCKVIFVIPLITKCDVNTVRYILNNRPQMCTNW